jgi:hypothetical protein
MEKVQVRLTKKFADMIDGVDLSRCMVGQTLHVTASEARLLIAEGWAESLEKTSRRPEPTSSASPAQLF